MREKNADSDADKAFEFCLAKTMLSIELVMKQAMDHHHQDDYPTSFPRHIS
jgi:hypothetical protein